MNVLRILRHGPLVFWLVVVLSFVSIFSISLRSGQAPAPAAAAPTSWDDVQSWRASLAQLPLLAAGGKVATFARSLQAIAAANAASAEDSGSVDLAAAWVYAAQSSGRLARAEPAGQPAIQAAVRDMGLAGDRLLLTVSGGKWVEASLPKKLDLNAPSLEDVDGGRLHD